MTLKDASSKPIIGEDEIHVTWENYIKNLFGNVWDGLTR